MARIYYKKRGFRGLTTAGKLIFILVLLLAGASVWSFQVRAEWARTETEAEGFSIGLYIWGGIKIIGTAFIAAYIVHFFLPRIEFHKQEFYCADCGEFLGYSIRICPRPQCGSNRYTTEDRIARHKLKNRNT